MEKSLALVLPDRPGALREVLHLIAAAGVSVQRSSYNRIVDAHTLFVDISGTGAEIQEVERALHERRLFPGERSTGEVRMLKFELPDRVGSRGPILELIERHGLNITRFELRTDGVDSGAVRVGLQVDDGDELEALVEEARSICPVQVVERQQRFSVVDNSNFYLNFARYVAQTLGLTRDEAHDLMVNANRIMQNLTQTDADPYRPFEQIGQMAEMIAACKGPAYAEMTRVTHFVTAGGAKGISVEPPVGCTTWVLEADECLLVFDGGFRCYAGELEGVLRDALPGWDERRKVLVLTHSDIDHVGDAARFDEVIASGRSIDNFMFESMGIVNWREQNVWSMPYILIAKTLGNYATPDWQRMRCMGEPSPFGEQRELMRRIDTLDVAPFSFEVWEGKGGHVRGETIYVERTHRLCVTGDNFVNVHGQTKPQARYNVLAPSLTVSVDMAPDLAREERDAIWDLLGPGSWRVLPGHGALLVRGL